MGAPLDDAALIKQVRQGQTDALRILFDRYYRLVFDIAKRILRDTGEAEDLTQEVFWEIYCKAFAYDSSRGTVKIWLLQYAYHRSFNRRKYLARRGFYSALANISLDYLEETRSRKAYHSVNNPELQQFLKLGMHELSETQQQIIEMVAMEGMTLREASMITGVGYVNSRNQYYRGLRKLRQFLHRTEHSPIYSLPRT
jgi:RNA polymerase sigma-70 factor, ECF subfamily